MTKIKWLALSALAMGGTLFHSGGFGCLQPVWDGFLNGFPTNNRWLNIGFDVLKEELLG